MYTSREKAHHSYAMNRVFIPFAMPTVRANSLLCSTRSFSSVSALSSGWTKIPNSTGSGILALQALRPSARNYTQFRTPITTPDENTNTELSCVAVSKCEKYNLSLVYSKLLKVYNPTILDGAVHAQIGRSSVFVLNNGSIVAWGPDMQQAAQILPLLQEAELGDQLELETEDMDFRFVESQPDAKTKCSIRGDVIIVPETKHQTESMLAFSNAMAKHTKLSSLETKVEPLLLSVKHISNAMASGSRPPLKAREVDVLTGKLLQLRGSLNLYSEITEVPDLYWSHPEQERLYELLSNHLDVSKRSDILNKKLDYASNTLSVLRSHLSEQLSLRLEWMIIILIMVEVAIEIKNLILE